jgi:hypothetical protein
VSNCAVFEIPDVLSRILEGDGDRGPAH